MTNEVIAARALAGHRIHLRFKDGTEGVIELEKFLEFRGVFAGLLDERVFATMKLNAELGTVQWENGADLAPEVLYEWMDKRDA
ncbi:MAG TPA: DUF2442 domain-containing protein [bacterium]|jgi:hypothetical protein|nr:DUF2442 domain-containing protein [bacterium]